MSEADEPLKRQPSSSDRHLPKEVHRRLVAAHCRKPDDLLTGCRGEQPLGRCPVAADELRKLALRSCEGAADFGQDAQEGSDTG